jgi:hypothetical protein
MPVHYKLALYRGMPVHYKLALGKLRTSLLFWSDVHLGLGFLDPCAPLPLLRASLLLAVTP